ncbi:MAG TPA: VOC family protein, partial [Gaiellaceae bacterium]|nr:VOC family protein [Gaiellaceae bacterium]
FDLDHVTLASRDPAAAADAWEAYGLQRVGETRLEVGGAFVDIVEGDPGEPQRPLLNHLAVLVDSVDEHVREAEARGIEIADVVDATNTLALFVWGPDRVKLEYVEHKPTFSLT